MCFKVDSFSVEIIIKRKDIKVTRAIVYDLTIDLDLDIEKEIIFMLKLFIKIILNYIFNKCTSCKM
jgi:hypothetical protein